MKLLRLLIVLAALATLFFPDDVTAQMGDDRQMLMDRLSAELKVTDEVLLRARDVVRVTDDETAMTILKMAAERQNWAKDQEAVLRHQFRLRLHSAAMNATGKAREQARNAIAAVRRTDRHEGVVARRLERTAALLDRVRLVAQDHPERERLSELYENANRNLKWAWEFHQRAEYRPALKLANQASSAANRILRALRAGRPGVEEFERRQDGLNRKIEEARERLQCEWVIELMDNAEQAYLDAIDLAERGQLVMAHQYLQKANEMISQAIRNCKGLDDINRGIERMKIRLTELVEKKDQLQGAQRDSFEAMLQQAWEQIELAENYASDNRHDAAIISVQAALKALNQARRIVDIF